MGGCSMQSVRVPRVGGANAEAPCAARLNRARHLPQALDVLLREEDRASMLFVERTLVGEDLQDAQVGGVHGERAGEAEDGDAVVTEDLHVDRGHAREGGIWAHCNVARQSRCRQNDQ